MDSLCMLLIWYFIAMPFCYCKFEIDGTFHLPKREGVEVGYTREITLGYGVKKTMKTISLNPTIFEIPDFLSSEECEYLIKLAKDVGLQASRLHANPEGLQSEPTTKETFDKWDKNSNGVLEPKEFTYIDGKGNAFLTEREVLDMMATLDCDHNNDNVMDFKEFEYVQASRIRSYFNLLRERNPLSHGRNSNQTWIWHYGAYDSLLEGFHEKLAKLTMLPHEVIEMSEPLQIVNYEGGGFYHCHHDSDEIDERVPCCNYEIQNLGNCRLCSNVTKGGETAFPVAGNETFSEEIWRNEVIEKCNLVDGCYSSNLFVKPRKGTAIMWYNHHIDERTGWVGDLDHRTFHGGCGVLEGSKWIANNWINIIGRRGSQDARLGWLRNRIDGTHDEF